MTSSMLDRVILAMMATVAPERVTMGSTISLTLSKPMEGSQPRWTENAMISNMPVQNVGIDTPKRVTSVVKLSNIEYCRTAQMTPRGIPISVLKTTAQNASLIVVGIRAANSMETGLFMT